MHRCDASYRADEGPDRPPALAPDSGRVDPLGHVAARHRPHSGQLRVRQRQVSLHSSRANRQRAVPDPFRENARVVAGRRRGALHLPMGLRLPALLSAYRAAAGAAARRAGPRADRFGDARGRRGHHAPPEVPRAARPPHEFRAGEPELCRTAYRGQARSTAAHRRKRARPGHRLCPHAGKGRNDHGFSERARHSGRILSRRHELPDALRASRRVDQRNDARHGRNQRIRHGDRQGRRPFRRALRRLRLARGVLPRSRASGTRRQAGLRRHAAFGRRRIESSTFPPNRRSAAYTKRCSTTWA